MTTDTSQHRNGAVKTPPSIEDFFLVSEKMTPNVMIEMITTSTNPQEYIPRSVVSKREAAALQRIIIQFGIWKKREVDVGTLVWNKLAYNIAVDGQGRKDAIEMFTGMGKRFADGLRNIGSPSDGVEGTGRGRR